MNGLSGGAGGAKRPTWQIAVGGVVIALVCLVLARVTPWLVADIFAVGVFMGIGIAAFSQVISKRLNGGSRAVPSVRAVTPVGPINSGTAVAPVGDGAGKRAGFVRKLIIGGAIVVAAIGGGVYEAKKFDYADKAEAGVPPNSLGNPQSAGAAQRPVIDTNDSGAHRKDQIKAMDPNAAATLDPAELTATFAGDFDRYRAQVYGTLLKTDLTAEQRGYLSVPPTTNDKSTWTDQQVVNAVTLDVADATLEEDLNTGKVELAAVLDPQCGGFQAIRDGMRPNGQFVANVDIYKVGNPEPRPKHNTFLHVPIGPNARLIFQSPVPGPGRSGGPSQYALYDLIQSNGASNWKMLRRWTADAEMQATVVAEQQEW